MMPLPFRVVAGHRRLVAGLVSGVAAFLVLPATIPPLTRTVLAWDIGCSVFLLLAAAMFRGERTDRIAADAEAQEEGEWTVFYLTISGISASIGAITSQYTAVKSAPGAHGWHIVLVVATLLVSWLMTHVVFALRYAHEYYAHDEGNKEVDGGLDFPGKKLPDYWDFVYFSLVIGKTFQVSDVQITSRKLRRLAAAHGFLSFVFNTFILALSVNIGASLM
jgi:uncharacterized membrane protein